MQRFPHMKRVELSMELEPEPEPEVVEEEPPIGQSLNR